MVANYIIARHKRNERWASSPMIIGLLRWSVSLWWEYHYRL